MRDKFFTYIHQIETIRIGVPSVKKNEIVRLKFHTQKKIRQFSKYLPIRSDIHLEMNRDRNINDKKWLGCEIKKKIYRKSERRITNEFVALIGKIK